MASISSGVSETPILNEDIALRSSMNGLPLAICLMGPTAAG
ncbi:MAG: hypothetical protein ACJAS1_003137, partial [Oleiphilaceae bacterium]